MIYKTNFSKDNSDPDSIGGIYVHNEADDVIARSDSGEFDIYRETLSDEEDAVQAVNKLIGRDI